MIVGTRSRAFPKEEWVGAFKQRKLGLGEVKQGDQQKCSMREGSGKYQRGYVAPAHILHTTYHEYYCLGLNAMAATNRTYRMYLRQAE
ncbi:hypothetical protein J6590_034731 [Homalodisca vitripennis]|nr:hypothetical protein J6590_034731 [Homalodisca vitripennis]